MYMYKPDYTNEKFETDVDRKRNLNESLLIVAYVSIPSLIFSIPFLIL